MRQGGLQAGLIAALTVVLAPNAIAQPVSGDGLFGPGEVIHVNAGCGDDNWTGLSADCAAPDGPKRTIKAGITAAQTGDTVLVADGTYTGFPGNKWLGFPFDQNSTLRSKNGPSARGSRLDAGEVGRVTRRT